MVECSQKNCNPNPVLASKKQKLETVTNEQASIGSEQDAEDGQKEIDTDKDSVRTGQEVSTGQEAIATVKGDANDDSEEEV